MAANWVKVGVAIGFGAVDKYAGDLDAAAVPARTLPFRTYSDYLRIAGAVGGLAVSMFMPKYEKFAEGITLPAVAFLTQSVWKYAAGTSGRVVTYTPVRQPVRSAPQSQFRGSMPVAQDVTLDDKLIV